MPPAMSAASQDVRCFSRSWATFYELIARAEDQRQLAMSYRRPVGLIREVLKAHLNLSHLKIIEA